MLLLLLQHPSASNVTIRIHRCTAAAAAAEEEKAHRQPISMEAKQLLTGSKDGSHRRLFSPHSILAAAAADVLSSARTVCSK